jgi:hypothetical protein
MKDDLTKLRIRFCLIAAIIGAAFLANPVPSLAQGPAGREVGARPAAPTSATQDARLSAIQAHAKAAAAN